MIPYAIIPVILCVILCLWGLVVLRKQWLVHPSLLSALLTLLLAVFLLRDFLTGSSLYLYTTSDGFSQYLSVFNNFIHTLKSSAHVPLWNISIGFGSVQSFSMLANPLFLIPIIFGVLGGEKILLICLAWMQVLKMAFAAFFMSSFLKKLGLHPFAVTAIGIIYALSGIMTIRGHWLFFADECYIIVLILYSIERYIKDQDWRLIPLSIYLLAAAMGAYYLYLYAILLFVYVTIRYYSEHNPLKKYPQYILKIGFCAVLGIAIWSFFLIGYGLSIFYTVRFVDTVGQANNPEQSILIAPSVLLSALLSLYDPNVLGIFEQYSGALNYLERPMLYVGTGCLLLIPQIFFIGEKKHRIIALFGCIAAILYFLITPVTDVLNAFMRNAEFRFRSYRLSSLWITVMIACFAAFGLHLGIKRGSFHRAGLLWTGLAEALVFTICCLLACNHWNLHLEKGIIIRSIVFFLLWVTILSVFGAGKKYVKSIIVREFILIIAVSEVFVSASTTYNASSTLAKKTLTDMQADVLGYYGDVKEAVSLIQGADSDWYRISGIRSRTGSATFCSPLYFSIQDSSYYTNINQQTYDFINELFPESFINGNGKKCSIGVGNDLILSTLTGYRYRIIPANEDYDIPYGYKVFATVNSVAVLKNSNNLSLGITYDRCVQRSVFEQFSQEEKRMILMYCAVVEDNSGIDVQPLSHSDIQSMLAEYQKEEGMDRFAYETLIAERKSGPLEIEDWSGDRITVTVSIQDDRLMVVSIPNYPGWHVKIDGVEVDTETVNLGFLGCNIPAGKHFIELTYRPPLYWFGIVLSIIAAMIYIVLLFSYRCDKAKRSR